MKTIRIGIICNTPPQIGTVLAQLPNVQYLPWKQTLCLPWQYVVELHLRSALAISDDAYWVLRRAVYEYSLASRASTSLTVRVAASSIVWQRHTAVFPVLAEKHQRYQEETLTVFQRLLKRVSNYFSWLLNRSVSIRNSLVTKFTSVTGKYGINFYQ